MSQLAGAVSALIAQPSLQLWFVCFQDKISQQSTWLYFISFCVFETWFHYVALTGFELPVQTRLALRLQSSACIYLPSAGARDLCHHTWVQAVFEQVISCLHLPDSGITSVMNLTQVSVILKNDIVVWNKWGKMCTNF